jgi:predicted lipid-binding transport protein (Tim44 family)
MGVLAGFAAGVLVGRWPPGTSADGLGSMPLGLLDLLLIGGGVVLCVAYVRRRRTAPALATGSPLGSSGPETSPAPALTGPRPGGLSGLEQGLRDIRRTDPGFDPARFAGYTAMVFREVQNAWTTRDLSGLRDRLTPELYGELQSHRDRLRDERRSNRVEQIEIRAEITEAWQEDARDYVTAHIAGAMVDYTVDELTDNLVNGSRAIPKEVEEYWTFTRPAGLNFWMLSAIQTS